MTDQNQNAVADDDELDLGKIIQLVLENWLLFAVSILLALIISYAYVWYSQPVYEMTTTVLVDDQGSDISQNILDEVGVVGKKRNIENEIAILSSRNLVEKAMATLNLNVSYTINLGLRKRDLYNDSPLKLDYLLSEDAPSAFLFTVHLAQDEPTAVLTYELQESNGDWTEYEQHITLEEQFSNPLGHFRLLPTEYFPLFASGDSARSLDYELQYMSNSQLATIYLGMLEVEEAREKASILRLRLKDQVGQRGEDVLDAILGVFIQNNIEKKNQLASNSLKFIEKQLDVITTDLTILESEIKGFKTSHGITDISSEATFFLQQVGSLDATVSEMDVKLSIINYLEVYITSDKDLKNASPSSLGIADPLLNALIVQLNTLSTERQSLLRFTKEDNPLVNALDLQIQETKKSLINNIASIRSGLEASKKELQKQLAGIEKKVKTLPKAEYDLLALQRQYSIKESLYLLLLEKKSENSILLASTVSDNMVIDKARSTEDPIKPKKSFVYLLGLLIGFGIPSFYLVLILIFDNRIKDGDHLKKTSPIPFLGVIPHHNETHYLVVRDMVNTAIAESFRSIRTNLSFLIQKNELALGVSPKVIQLTSAMGSEGKSFCSINLAASLALGGAKTIVVGLDLRKPKLAEYFSLSNKIGASSVLAGMESLENAILSTEIENLDVLVAGPVPPNPSELLMGKGLTEMLENLTQMYDHVVLDTPPIGLVTDSLIISEHAATTIYVVRQNVTNLNSMQYINDLYRSKKIKSISLLFNDVKSSKFGYGYGYGYGQGYYIETVKLTKWQRLKLFLKPS
ncbi:MAG: polysaccharide biosynthesis tyrosine autokinase [Flavobacteriales bacterium]|nr:polysaccharide biosynthesis tyrosine autokinase [Flavobacteriales bacterium]